MCAVADGNQDTVEKVKAKLIEAAGVYRQDKEVSLPSR
jgi:hypothetical protein